MFENPGGSLPTPMVLTLSSSCVDEVLSINSTSIINPRCYQILISRNRFTEKWQCRLEVGESQKRQAREVQMQASRKGKKDPPAEKGQQKIDS